MTESIAMFLIPLRKKQLTVLNWGGNGATFGRLKAKSILLPTLSNGEPDWEYMNGAFYYNLKELEHRKDKQLIKNTPLKLTNVEWKEFSLSDIFSEAKRGNAGAKSKLYNGSIPLISARKQDNGFDKFVNVPETKTIKNCISVVNNGDGAAGRAFYHNYRYTATQDVTNLIGKAKLSNAEKMFISVCITHQENKYGHANKVTSDRLMHQKIKLPVEANGKINWNFMDEYIESIIQL